MSPTSPVKIFLIDDDSSSVLSLAKLIKAKDPAVTVEATAKIDGVELQIKKFDPDVAVLDLTLDPKEGPSSGLKLLATLVRSQPFCRIIVLTGDASSENGVRALERGAAHFLAKPADIHHLMILIADAAALARLKRNYQNPTEVPDLLETTLVGVSAGIQHVREEIRAAAKTNQNVFIFGETGTGKGVCARALHQLSNRHNQQFVRYQPSFASGDLVLSELFGHRKGAFTGALEDRSGLLKRAENGTLFLDEIDELPGEVQVALLGVLQEGKYRSLGVDVEKSVDVRFVAASNRPLEESFASGKLRKDLYYRLGQRKITLSPLRERTEDIVPISQSILQRVAEDEAGTIFEFSDAAKSLLASHSFPGNIRELEALVIDGYHRAAYRGDSVILAEDLRMQTEGGDNVGASFHTQMNALKKKLIREALSTTGNNQVQAAKLLKLDRSSFRRMLSESLLGEKA